MAFRNLIKTSKFIGGRKLTTLILWEANESLIPIDREERVKVILSGLEGTKKFQDPDFVIINLINGNRHLI